MSDFERLTDEQRFQLLVNAVTDYAIYMLDPEGNVATWNPGAQRIKGYSASEIVGRNFSSFFTPEDVAAGLPARALAEATREGRFEAEGWRVRKDGTRFWANAILDPIRSDSGGLIGFVKITRDITERREHERRLYESEQRFRMLVEGVRDYAIYMLDPTGRITNWNSGAEAIKGYSASEIVGEHFSRFYTEGDRASGEPQRALETALATGVYEREAWRVRKDGSLFRAHVVIDPIFNDDGDHIGFAKITRDVTDQHKAREELEEARLALAQSQKLQALGELTGGIAHDFNNLMTVIEGSADFLLRKPDLPIDKRMKYLEAIAETASRATTLTDHLLAFARRQPIQPEVLDVNVRIDAFAEVLARTIGSEIDVELNLAPDLRAVEVDVGQLENALLNAALNARDAMPNGGRLTITTSNVPDCDSGAVLVEIADTGLGMPQRVIERAFEPFFTTKDVGKGTGLGLSQIHGFAAQAGGRAEIRSAEGEGTTISLILPATDCAPSAPREQRDNAPFPKGITVLLVEDNAQVREFAEGLLRDLDCEVIAAEDAVQAMEKLESNAVDIVFSDIVMPGASGIELAQQIREKYPQTPVLLATGYSDEVVGGRTDFAVIRKPYSLGAVSDALSALLSEARNRAA